MKPTAVCALGSPSSAARKTSAEPTTALPISAAWAVPADPSARPIATKTIAAFCIPRVPLPLTVRSEVRKESRQTSGRDARIIRSAEPEGKRRACLSRMAQLDRQTAVAAHVRTRRNRTCGPQGGCPSLDESPGGLSPPGAPRTVREPLDSYGSRCSAIAMTLLPVSEEGRLCSAKPLKPVSRPFGLPTQPLEFAARPADDIDIDPFKGRTQLRPVEVTVVVDPALNVRIVRLGQILQGLVAVMVKGPPPDRPADRLQRFRTGGRHEAVRVDAPAPHRLPRSKCKPEKVERLVRKVPTPVRILAVDDLRLRRVQYQLAGREAILQRAP